MPASVPARMVIPAASAARSTSPCPAMPSTRRGAGRRRRSPSLSMGGTSALIETVGTQALRGPPPRIWSARSRVPCSTESKPASIARPGSSRGACSGRRPRPPCSWTAAASSDDRVRPVRDDAATPSMWVSPMIFTHDPLAASSSSPASHQPGVGHLARQTGEVRPRRGEEAPRGEHVGHPVVARRRPACRRTRSFPARVPPGLRSRRCAERLERTPSVSPVPLGVFSDRCACTSTSPGRIAASSTSVSARSPGSAAKRPSRTKISPDGAATAGPSPGCGTSPEHPGTGRARARGHPGRRSGDAR